MGKASRSKQRLTVREKVAIQREAERRANARKRYLVGSASVVVILAIVSVFIVTKALSGKTSAGALPTGAALAAVVSGVTKVPPSTLAAVQAGPASGADKVTPPTALPPGQAPLTQNGKPVIVYVGAEYCPYCAAERWAMVVALSRFGTFSNLGAASSSAETGEAFPGTKTLTFYKSSYSSPYLVFSPAEQEDTNRKPLQALTSQQQALISKYDSPPYLPSAEQGSIPFIDIANKYMISGASYTPAVLQGLTWQKISTALANPSSPVAKSVDGTANLLTAAICKVTNDRPASVCASPSITALSGKA
jgi:thiol-disulfide isomerase/thioredoxin